VFTEVNSESATLISQKDSCYYTENLGKSCGSQCIFTLMDNISFLNEKLILVFQWIKLAIFLGSFAKLRRATVVFVLSICLAVHMGQLSSQWTDCVKFYIWIFFKKLSRKFTFY